VASALVLVPQVWSGLLVVALIVLTNLACTVATTLLFLRWTRFSRQGNYWQSVAQVVSDETRWIVEQAPGLRDAAVGEMIRHRGGTETRVAIGKSFEGAERVQILRSRPAYNRV
jgi:hypothetical protein